MGALLHAELARGEVDWARIEARLLVRRQRGNAMVMARGDAGVLLADRPPPPPFAIAELFEEFARPAAWRLDDAVPAVLDELAARGLRLAVVSNWDERLPRLLERMELAPRFAAIVYSQEVGVEKPHAAIFRTALARLGVEPAAALHVGDRRLEDVEGARAAGLDALWLSSDGRGDLGRLRDLPGRLDTLA
jgi:putative hydrolase of the HAD superfamily